MVRGWSVKPKQMQIQTHTARAKEDHTTYRRRPRYCRRLKVLERDYDAGCAHTRYSHEVGSAYKPEGYSRHSPNHLIILLICVTTVIVASTYRLAVNDSSQDHQ